MDTITIMTDKIQLIRIGNSAGFVLNKGVLQAYNLKVGDEIEIEFEYPDIILRTKPKKRMRDADETRS